MFTVRVHLAGLPGHSVYECREYGVTPEGSKVVIRMMCADGATREIELKGGGLAYVMGDSGKTVEVIRSRPVDVQHLEDGQRPMPSQKRVAAELKVTR